MSPGGACVSPHAREKGRKERETLQQMAEVTREGFRLKKILIEDWKKAREEKQVRGPGLTRGGGMVSGASSCLRLQFLVCPLGVKLLVRSLPGPPW